MEHIVKEYGEPEVWKSSGLRLRNCTSGHPIGEHPPHQMESSDNASELSLAQFRVLDRCHDEDEDWGSRHWRFVRL